MKKISLLVITLLALFENNVFAQDPSAEDKQHIAEDKQHIVKSSDVVDKKEHVEHHEDEKSERKKHKHHKHKHKHNKANDLKSEHQAEEAKASEESAK